MPILRFTDRTLAALACGRPQRDYWDATLPGFGVRIGARTKTFFIRYRTAQAQRRQILGTYPSVTLAEARSQAQAVLRSCDAGHDPAQDQTTARERTFGALAVLYLEKHAMRKKRSWRDDARMIRIELATWHDRPIRSLRRVDVRELLDEVVARGAPVLANRVLALIRKMLNFGLDREWIEANVAAKMPRPTIERARTRVLSPAELERLWAWLARPAPANLTIDGVVRPINAEHWRLAQAVLQLRLLTAQRGSEITAMRWTDLDLETGWWTIPTEIAKNGLAHRVFLAPAVVTILRGLSRTAGESASAKCNFPAASSTDGAVFRGIVGPRHRRPILIGLPVDNFQPKDLRRTASSLMTGGGVPRETVKRVLNHVERDITAVYDRYSYDPEKRQALLWWAARLDAIVTGRASKVLPFRRA